MGERMNNENGIQPTILVIFGATGDLSRRKLIPALYNLFLDNSLPEKFLMLGLGRMDDEKAWREGLKKGIKDYSRRGAPEEAKWNDFVKRLSYMPGGFEEATTYSALDALIEKTEKFWGAKANHLYYLAIPPTMIETVIGGLGKAHLNRDRKRDRVIIEKPFGRDLASAEHLNTAVTNIFQEHQVYRIDHYLGKETVQNLLAFRFGNALFEPIWNRSYIDHVQITVAEDEGVGTRGGFYETAGALRDMVQNHILQLLCMVAMEPPVSFAADEVRNKKVDVLRAVRPIAQGEMYKNAVRGQYGAGHTCEAKCPGYREEAGVAPDSATETYAALKLHIDNWRWQDVPFYVRTGKRLPRKVSQISIEFRPVPHQIFPNVTAEHWEPNRLVINVQPREGIVIRFQAKQPGRGMRLQTVNLDFYYADAFKTEAPEAYETLLHDVMIGDTTLFMRADQEHEAWSIVTPILQAWSQIPSADFPNYAAGTWGPESGEALIARDGRSWHSVPLEQ